MFLRTGEVIASPIDHVVRALTMQDSIIEFKTIYYILFMVFY
jgi:hypothetical protein